MVAESEGLGEVLVRVGPEDVVLLHEEHPVASKPAPRRAVRKTKAVDATKVDLVTHIHSSKMWPMGLAAV